MQGLQREWLEVCRSEIFVGDRSDVKITQANILKFQKMLAQQTVQGMRYSPKGSLWHFSAKSKDNKTEFQEDRRK